MIPVAWDIVPALSVAMMVKSNWRSVSLEHIRDMGMADNPQSCAVTVLLCPRVGTASNATECQSLYSYNSMCGIS